MAEVRLEPRRRSAWPWLLALLALALVIWSAGEILTSESPASAAAHSAAPGAAHGAVVRPAGPRQPAPTRDDPQREEALRIRSRIMA
jgi:hypothetical protein